MNIAISISSVQINYIKHDTPSIPIIHIGTESIYIIIVYTV